MRTPSDQIQPRLLCASLLGLAIWLVACIAALLLVPDTLLCPLPSVREHIRPDMPALALVHVIGIVAAVATIIKLSCVCSHTLYRFVVDLDRASWLCFRRADRRCVALFNGQSVPGRIDLTHLSRDNDAACRQVLYLRYKMDTVGYACIMLIAVFVILFAVGHVTFHAHYVWIGVLLLEVGSGLLRCSRAIRRDYPHVGPTQADVDGATKEYSVFDAEVRQQVMAFRPMSATSGL